MVEDDYGERFDPVSGLPLPEDDGPQLTAALAEWHDELRELHGHVPADGWAGVP